MFFTTKETLATDLAGSIEFVKSNHGVAPILFGHSAGGGLAQATLNSGLLRSRSGAYRRVSQPRWLLGLRVLVIQT